MVSELVGEDDTDLVVLEAAVKQGVPQKDATARPEPGCIGVRHARQLAPLLDLHLHGLRLLTLGKADSGALEVGRR
jgi:hypothetical protein